MNIPRRKAIPPLLLNNLDSQSTLLTVGKFFILFSLNHNLSYRVDQGKSQTYAILLSKFMV